MKIEASTVSEYLSHVPSDRKDTFFLLREAIIHNLPKGFSEEINYGMIGYVVPHTLYPAGYHCDPKLPLPFINIGIQKNFIGFYHMGIYADKNLLDWFVEEYKNTCKYKLDMGKSCIRLKKNDGVPFELIGQLVQKISPNEWIELYEKQIKK